MDTVLGQVFRMPCLQSKIIMGGSFFYRIFVLCWLALLAFPALGDSQEAFLELLVEPSVLRLEAELAYSGPEDQSSLKKAAEREIASVFTVSTGNGSPLSGQLKEVQFGPGTRRDEISGEALGEDPKGKRLRAVWEYPYSGQPEQLVVRSKAQQPLLFVTRHLGVRLHDQTALQAQQSLSLDWKDPWYSGFVQPELTRTPHESVACYLYLEPGQTRLEVLARVRDLQPLGELELGSEPLLSLETQATLAEQVGEILKSRLGVEMNERPLELQLEKVAFVNRTPTSADAFDPPQPVPTQVATVGAILVGPAVTEEGNLKLRCELFGPRVREIPAFLAEGEQEVREVTLLPDQEGVITLEARPEAKALSPVRAPRGSARGIILLMAFAGLALGAFLMIRNPKGTFVLGMGLWAGAGLSVFKWAWGPEKAVIKERLQSVLGNIYQAFEAPTEEAVYDRLAISVEGELLSEVYLQTRKGLEAEKGVQVDVERVDVGWAKVTSSDWWGDGVRVRALWEVSGRVGHWGHEHQRTNWYKADLKLKSVDGDWKLTELEVIDEIRM